MGGPKYQNTAERERGVRNFLPTAYILHLTYFLGATPERLKETTSASREALRCAVQERKKLEGSKFYPTSALLRTIEREGRT